MCLSAGWSVRPALPRRKLATRPGLELDVELYFTVNGAELRPASGGFFHGKYKDYLGNYRFCLP